MKNFIILIFVSIFIASCGSQTKFEKGYQKDVKTYTEEKDWGNLVKTYKDFLKNSTKQKKYRYKNVIINYNIYEAYLKLNQKQNADEYLKKTYQTFNELKAPKENSSEIKEDYKLAKFLAAKTNFLQIEKKISTYEKMPLGGEDYSINIKNKIAFAAELVELYDLIISKYSEPEWSFASYFRKGYLNQQFSEALMSAETPESFDVKEEFRYKKELEKFSKSFFNVAKNIYKEAYEYSIKLNINNEWTNKILVELNKIDSNTYKLVDKNEVKKDKSNKNVQKQEKEVK